MDYTDIQTKQPDELHAALSLERERLRELLFRASEAQLSNVREIRTCKKTIARMLTELARRAARV